MPVVKTEYAESFVTKYNWSKSKTDNIQPQSKMMSMSLLQSH